MNKATRLIIGFLLLFIAVLIVIPFAINTSSLKFQLEQKISQKLGTNFEIKGSVDITFFPTTKVIADNVFVAQLEAKGKYFTNIKVGKLTIKPSIFSLFSHNIKINKIIFDNLNIESSPIITQENENNKKEDKILAANKKIDISDVKSKTFVNKIFGFENSSNKIFSFKNIKSIEVNNSNFSKKNKTNATIIDFSKINLDIKNNLTKQIFTINGNFLSQNIPTQFKLVANTNKNKDSSLIIQSPIIELSASGRFDNSNISNLVKANFDGKLNAQIIDLKAFLNKYFSKNNALFNKINPTKPIKISAGINSKEGEIKIGNIIINSQLIDGSGQIQANFSNPKASINADFDFNNIDIDSLWFSGASDKKKSNSNNAQQEIIVDNYDPNKTRIIINSGENQNKETSIFSNLDLITEINIKTTRYMGANLQDVRLYFIVSDSGDVLLQPLTANIPGGSTLKVTGTIKNQDDTPKFVGDILVSGKNLEQSLSWLKFDLKNLKQGSLASYKLSANLLMMPDFVILSGLILDINNGKNIITGDIKNDDSSGTSNTYSNLRINYFNYDDYFKQDTGSEYLSKGSLLKKLLWLNTISSNRNILLFFDQLIYKNHLFSNQSLKVKLGQGFFKINDFNIMSSSLDVKGDIEFDIRKNKPQLDINIKSKNFSYKNITDKNFSNQFFSLPSLDEFSGNLAINISNLAIDDWWAKDVKISGKIKDGIASFDSFKLKTYGGDAEYEGIISFKKIKTINGSLSLIGINNQNFLNDLMRFDNVSGISNISAVISSSADNKDSFFKHLDVSAQFISANIIVKSFGIFDLATKMSNPDWYAQELKNPLDILYNKNSQSFLKNAKGAIDIKGNKIQNFNIETSTLGINGVVSGSFNLEKKYIDSSANFIFISGNNQNPIPINIATNFKGYANNLEKNTNLTQVNQYLNR